MKAWHGCSRRTCSSRPPQKHTNQLSSFSLHGWLLWSGGKTQDTYTRLLYPASLERSYELATSRRQGLNTHSASLPFSGADMLVIRLLRAHGTGWQVLSFSLLELSRQKSGQPLGEKETRSAATIQAQWPLWRWRTLQSIPNPRQKLCVFFLDNFWGVVMETEGMLFIFFTGHGSWGRMGHGVVKVERCMSFY